MVVGTRARRLALSVALTDNERTRPIVTGEVRAEAIDLRPSVLNPGEIFWRQLEHAEFDVSEMSLASYAIATAKGATAWTALPVFPVRRVFHAGILVRRDAGIAAPGDLAGRRVGVPEYQQTAVVWTRGVLQHEFGVDPRSLEWFVERGPERSHGGATGFVPPRGIRLAYVAPDATLAGMLLSGALDALLFYVPRRDLLNRSGTDLRAHPAVRRLFPDPAAEARRFVAKTGLYPINHCVVVRRAALERHPWLALNLYAAFEGARASLDARRAALLEPWFETGRLGAEARDALRDDPLRYGVAATRNVVETLLGYLAEQGLTPRRLALEELFAASTLTT